MQVKEKKVSIQQAEKIFELIIQELNITKNIQIFVEKELVKELRMNGAKHKVYSITGSKSYHYYKDSDEMGGEIWYEYHSGNKVYSASFVSNCKEYFQLVEFPKLDNSTGYIHYIEGFDELLLIKVDT